jgi:hypothetical protein
MISDNESFISVSNHLGALAQASIERMARTWLTLADFACPMTLEERIAWQKKNQKNQRGKRFMMRLAPTSKRWLRMGGF